MNYWQTRKIKFDNSKFCGNFTNPLELNAQPIKATSSMSVIINKIRQLFQHI